MPEVDAPDLPVWSRSPTPGHSALSPQRPVASAVLRGILGLPEDAGFGSGTCPVVFSRDPSGRVTALHLGVQPLSFQKRPDALNPRPWVAGGLAAAAMALAAGHRHRTHRAVAITDGRT